MPSEPTQSGGPNNWLVNGLLRALAACVVCTLLAPHSVAGPAIDLFCLTADSSLDDARERLPVAVGKATQMLHIKATTQRVKGQCTIFARHTVDTDVAAQGLLKAIHRGGAESATLKDAYAEMGTERYRQAMVDLLRQQATSHPMLSRLEEIPRSLRDSITIEFVYEYSSSERVAIEPITLRLQPADAMPLRP